MEVFGLDRYFDFEHSGFAEEFYLRDDLARHAYDIARREWGEDIEAIYVIGDTIYDIQCGKAIGAKTISVATGHYDKDVLAEQKPWRLFTHLPASAEMTRLIH